MARFSADIEGCLPLIRFSSEAQSPTEVKQQCAIGRRITTVVESTFVFVYVRVVNTDNIFSYISVSDIVEAFGVEDMQEV